MANYKFYFGYKSRSYTSTTTGGYPSSHTAVVESNDISWLNLNIEVSPTGKWNDGALKALGEALTPLINTAVAPNPTEFDYDLAPIYAFQLTSATTDDVYFSLYDYDEETGIFTEHTVGNADLADGSYGLLCSKVKSPLLNIVYKPGYDSSGAYTALKTEKVTLNCNSTSAAIPFASIDGQYIARTALDIDSTHTLAGLSNYLPDSPSFFFLNSYSKSTHILDYFIDQAVPEGSTNTYELWGPRIFNLIAVLSAGLTTSDGKDVVQLACTCYETNKAPTRLTIQYENTVTSYKMGTQTVDISYKTRDPLIATIADPNNCQLLWDESIRDLVPGDSIFVLDSAKNPETFSNGKWQGGAVEYSATCKLYPSKYTIKIQQYIMTQMTSDNTQTISLIDNIKYSSLFADYCDYVIQEYTGEDTYNDITIQVRLDSIKRDGSVINKSDTIIFSDLCTGSTVTIVGTYNRYFNCVIKYYGKNIFSPTNSPSSYTYDKDGVINGPDNQQVLPIEFLISGAEQTIQCDTRDLDSTLSAALELNIINNILYTADSTPVVRGTSTRIYTNNVDATLTFNVDSPTPATFFSSKDVDTWYSKDVMYSFSNFKEDSSNQVLNTTLRNFLDNSSDLTIKVYGDFFPAKEIDFSSQLTLKPNCICPIYFLYQPKAQEPMDDVTTPGLWEPVFLYYGREFTYLELMEYLYSKHNIQFTLSFTGEVLTNCVIDSVTSVPTNSSGSLVSKWKINYTTPPVCQRYNVKYLKRIDVVDIDLTNAVYTVTSNKFSKEYADYTWEPLAGKEKFQLPKDLVASTISNYITGGKLILIASEGHPATNVYSDITLNNGCFPTKIIDSNFTNQEGVAEQIDGSILSFNRCLDLSGIMGLSCTAFDTGSANTRTKTIYDLLNNEHTRAHTGAASVRSRFVIGAVGAGAGGTAGDPQFMWGHYGGGGGGSGAYGIWYVDLVAMGKKYSVDWKGFKLKYSGGVGGSTPTTENTQGENGTSLFLSIVHDDYVDGPIIQIEVYAGGKAKWTSGGAGGAKPKVTGGHEDYFVEIKASEGVGGRRGESGSWTVDSDETDHKLPTSLEINPSTDYDHFLRNENSFLGIYLDEAKYGKYSEIDSPIKVEAYSYKDYHNGYATKSTSSKYSTSAVQQRVKNILASEQALKKEVYNNPYGLTLATLFGGNYYYQRLVSEDSNYSLGGTGAPSICGFPTYWLKTKEISDRIPGSVISGTDLTNYESKPCYGAGGCGGSATYVGGKNANKAEKCHSKGRPGGDSYWAIFC